MGIFAEQLLVSDLVNYLVDIIANNNRCHLLYAAMERIIFIPLGTGNFVVNFPSADFIGLDSGKTSSLAACR